MSSSLILCNKNEPFLGWTIMCDGNWIVYANWWWSAHWLNWEPPKHFAKLNLHQKMAVVTVCWSAVGLIHDSFLNPSKTTMSKKYVQQIDEIHWKLQHLEPSLVNRNGPVLFHNNTWPHITQSTVQKLNKLGYKVLPHPPYSLDLLSTSYHFLKHLDNFL